MTIEQLLLNRIDKAHSVCQQNKICGHDRNHHQRVFSNALVINGLLTQPESEHDLRMLVLAHDIGYSCTGIVWEGAYAINHVSRGNEVLRRAATIFISHEQQHHALTLIKNLPISTQDAIKSLVDSPSEFLPLSTLIKLADILDYFHESRVSHLSPPHIDEDDYYFLAHSVASYTLKRKPPNTLAWTLVLKSGIDEASWKEKVQNNFSTIFVLASLVMQRLHHTIEVHILTKETAM